MRVKENESIFLKKKKKKKQEQQKIEGTKKKL